MTENFLLFRVRILSIELVEIDSVKGKRTKLKKMDPVTVKSTSSILAFGDVMVAAARNLEKEMVTGNAQPSISVNKEVNLDELMGKEAEKRQILKRQGHGECREVTGEIF